MNNLETNNVPETRHEHYADKADSTQTEESRGIAMNIFAILGFIAILLAGLWATTQIVKQVSSMSFNFDKPSMSIFGFGDNDKLTLLDGEGVMYSGEPASIKWELSAEAKENVGAITTLSYGCKRGLYLKVQVKDTNTYRALPCNTVYSIPTTETVLAIIPILTDADLGEIEYAITYTPTQESDLESQTVQGSLQIAKNEEPVESVANITEPELEVASIVNNVATKPKTHYTNTIRTVVPVRTSDPSGMPDLTVKILEVTQDDINDKVTVRFEIANIGTKIATDWILTASLPTEPAYTYGSEVQQALYAGERAEMQLTFTKLKAGINPLLITVDANNSVIESLENNNIVVQNIVK